MSKTLFTYWFYILNMWLLMFCDDSFYFTGFIYLFVGYKYLIFWVISIVLLRGV